MAEVFTPSWICNQQINLIDEDWFGRTGVFNTECGSSWQTNPEKIEFTAEHPWQEYVDANRLEITCGEAPYLVSRYDTVTGALIDLKDRIGLLDRKLRVVRENCSTEAQWHHWSQRAFQSSYGFEYMGDSLLLARENLLYTYADSARDFLNRDPRRSELESIAHIISWNIWQMDGITKCVPCQTRIKAAANKNLPDHAHECTACQIYDWQADRKVTFASITAENHHGCLKTGETTLKSDLQPDDLPANAAADLRISMKFQAVPGNPPYQETTDNTSDFPVYHLFMDIASSLADKSTFITPARFLTGAGKTPKEWNDKILNDEHFKVAAYFPDSTYVFPAVDIKGGVAITYRDNNADFGRIGFFTPFKELSSVLSKVCSHNFISIQNIIYLCCRFDLEKLYAGHPHLKTIIGSNGRERRLTTNIFSQVEIFSETSVGSDDIEIYGLINNKRYTRFIPSIFIENISDLQYFKVIIPKSNGSGKFGEPLSAPFVGAPGCGYSQSFISFGRFNKESEAQACLKYLKTKFVRCLLSSLKTTQDNSKAVWAHVPLQDFTDGSDLDWSLPVAELDRQLYCKYGLSEQEIDFIESKTMEMA